MELGVARKRSQGTENPTFYPSIVLQEIWVIFPGQEAPQHKKIVNFLQINMRIFIFSALLSVLASLHRPHQAKAAHDPD